MQDVNKVILVGRLTRDLGTNERDFGYVQSGIARAQVSIAVNRGKKQGDQWIEEVSYFDVIIWGKTAENIKPYLTKGKQICVCGYLKQDRWEKDGQKLSRVFVVAEQVQKFGNGEKNNAPNPNTVYPTAQEAQSAFAKQYNQQNTQGSFQEDLPYDTGSDYPEDIPF